MITVVLNGYKRSKYFETQLNSIRNQTLQPSDILLWQNAGDVFDENLTRLVTHASCNRNLGVWARFAFALNANTEYICVFDDDTIPGKKWLENCLNTIGETEGVLGTVGALYLNPLPPEHSSYFEHYIRFGWPDAGNNEKTVEVDWLGHSWFFKKEWLSHMFRELPDPKYNICGEDMHLSYMLQKYGGLKSYVPPHPKNDKEMWGSIKGAEYGGDQNSLWETNQLSANGTPFKNLMNEYFNKQRRDGWKLVMDKN
jgi:GT2 family glycosyltransferase